MLSGQQINQTAETFISQMGISQKKKKNWELIFWLNNCQDEKNLNVGNLSKSNQKSLFVPNICEEDPSTENFCKA